MIKYRIMKKKNLSSFILGILAGVSIALGGILNILSKAYFGIYGSLVGSFLFPVGLTLVCYLGLNLFTGKIGFLLNNNKDYIKFLVIIYAGNILGAFLVGLLSILFLNNFKAIVETIDNICKGKIGTTYNLETFLRVFAKSIICGVLVYLAVYFYKNFKLHLIKLFGIFICIGLFVYFGCDHCIANAFYFSYGNQFLNPNTYLNLLICTVGNSFGAIMVNELVRKTP